MDAEPRDASRALTAAVRARLAPVCAGWPADAFAALVADVVRFRERWDAQGAPWPRTAPDTATLFPLLS